MTIHVGTASFCAWLFILFSPSAIGMDVLAHEVKITPNDAKTYGIMFDNNVLLRSSSAELFNNSLSIQRILQALRNYQIALKREEELEPGQQGGLKDSHQLLHELTRLESEINISVVKN